MNYEIEQYVGELKFLRGISQLREGLVSAFPGLIDGESDVNGADLVDWLSNYLQESQE